MQLYQVSFQAHYEDMIDVGSVLVCAASNDDAADRVRLLFDLPQSRSTFDVKRIKGNLWQLERREIERFAAARATNKALSPLANWFVSVSATIRAANETSAWTKFGHHVLTRAKSPKALVDKAVLEFDAEATRADSLPKGPATDKQSIYRETRFFQGGAARPR